MIFLSSEFSTDIHKIFLWLTQQMSCCIVFTTIVFGRRLAGQVLLASSYSILRDGTEALQNVSQLPLLVWVILCSYNCVIFSTQQIEKMFTGQGH